MKRLLTLLGVLSLAAAVGGCAGFERTETIISPLAPSLPSAPTGAGLTGSWSSLSPLNIPHSWSRRNCQWSITYQSANSLAGDFYAICAGIVLVQGNISGQLNGAGTEVALRLTGTATVQGVITCPFDLSGTGYIQGNESI